MSTAFKVVASALLLVGVGGSVLAYQSGSRREARAVHSVPQTAERAAASESSEVSDEITETAATAPSAPRAAERLPLDEPTLMTNLRAFGHTDHERAIRLAREGNIRFPTSRDAAERGWYVVKSLNGLGRFHEARDEARTMVARFRGTPWADDVERHTLVYPLDQPSREELQELEQ